MSNSDSALAGVVIELADHDERPSHAMRAVVVRTHGYDVARAIAVLGMVMVDVRHEQLAYDRGPAALLWLLNGLEGKAAALFVLLAGAGLSLRMRRHDVDEELHVDRRPFFERALLLIGGGLLLMHLWKYEILHFHGIYLLLAIPLLRAHSRTLWSLAIASIWVAMVLHNELDWTVQPTLTLGGAMRHVFFNGLYPVFPWFAFLLVGMAIGRLDLNDGAVRRRTMTIALVVAFVVAAVDSLGRYEQQTGALGLGGLSPWLLTWPREPRPLFVVSGCAIAVALICGCIALTREREHSRWVMALVATGQLAFTLYVLHVFAIRVPLEHGFLLDSSLELGIFYSIAFYVASIAFALWWRRRWPHGPIEGLMRQFIARERPADWHTAGLRRR